MNDIFNSFGLNNRLVRSGLAVVVVLIFTYFSRCNKDNGMNMYSVEDDLKLGAQLSQQIASDPTQYRVLDETKYAKAYSHLRRITNNILASGKVKNKDKFKWQIKIIYDDATLNAFCAPGGYIYVYTGIIKFLDKESELAGVMGHEIAHADLRHSTEALTQQRGAEVITAVITGNSHDQLASMGKNLVGLGYSRDNESEADAASVEYLCGSKYDARGTAGFFEKLAKQGKSGRTPAFLSTHPNPENRVEKIHQIWKEKGCSSKIDASGNDGFEAEYQDFKNSLP